MQDESHADKDEAKSDNATPDEELSRFGFVSRLFDWVTSKSIAPAEPES